MLLGNSVSLSVFELSQQDGKPLPRLNLEALRARLAQELHAHRVPADLRTSRVETRGWCWLDDVSLINVGPWIAWGLRTFLKRPPSALINAMIDERIATWRGDHGDVAKVPRPVKSEIHDLVVEEITRATPPNVVDEAILYDAEEHMLYLFLAPGSQLDGRVAHVARVLRDALLVPTQLRTQRRDIALWFGATRAESIMPAFVHERLLTWMLNQGRTGQWYAWTDADGVPHAWQVQIDRDLRVEVPGGQLRVEGEEAVEQWVESNGNAEKPVKRGTFRITHAVGLSDDAARSYTMDIDTQGLRRIRFETTPVEDEDAWEERVMLAGDAYKRALQAFEAGLLVFDNTELARVMQEDPQPGLWPHLVNVRVRVVDTPTHLLARPGTLL